MDLNPVEVRDIYDYQISQNIEILDKAQHKFISNIFYEENLYEDEKIGQLVSIIREKTLNKLILESLVFVESNDHSKLTGIIHNLKEIRFSKTISIEEAQILLTLFDKYVKKNFHDFNLLNDVFSLMIDLISMKNILFKLDWRVYYMMFIQFYGITKKEFAWNYSEKYLQKIQLCDFIKKARKFFVYTKEDYYHLKEEILNRLTTIDGHITFGLLTAQLFLPDQYFKDDCQLQEKFMTILEHQSKHANYVFLNFCKILKFGIQIDKLRFIENFFSVLSCLLSDGMSLTYFYWPDAVNKDRHCNITVCYILAILLIKSEYDEYKDIILKNFSIVLNLLSADLTENNCSTFTFDFIKNFLRNLKHLACHVNEYEISEYDSFNEYNVLEVYREKVDVAMKFLKPIISKCFLYNDSSTYSLFLEYVALTDISQIHSEFHDIIKHLYENSFNDYNFFIKKITIFLRCFMENIENRETFNFLNELIETSADKISCANEALNRNIIDFFNVLYTLCLNYKEKVHKKSSNFNILIIKINSITISIVKKILRLINFFSNVIKEMQLELFLYHMDKLITIETRREICGIISNHLRNNTFKENTEFQLISNFIQYLKIDSDEKCKLGKNIWNYGYNTLVEGESPYDDYSSLKLRENSKDQFTYIKNLLINCVDYEDVNEEEFFSLIRSLLNNKQGMKKLAYQILKYLCYNILLPRVKKNKIIYPSSDKLKLILKVYEIIIQPYEISLTEKFETVKKISNSNIEEREKLLNICKKDFEDLDDIMTIYLRITYSFMQECNNIFMRDLNNFESELKEIISSFTEIELYQILKSLRERINEKILNFYQISKKLKIFKKSEKYFRRNFAVKLLDLDRFYHIRLISNIRRYLVYYRELHFEEIHFIYKNISQSSLYSHIKLFKLQEKPDLNLIERIFKFYINFEDKKLINNSIFKISNMIRNIPSDSQEAYDFFERIMSLVYKKMEKIQISKEIIINDVKKFERIIDVIYGFVENFLNKIADITVILNTLNKFRMIIDKFKFSTSNELEYLTILTNSANYKLSKPQTLFKIKTAQAFSNYVNNLNLNCENVNLEKLMFTYSERILHYESIVHSKNIQIRTNIRNYLKENLENQFRSDNKQDSLELIIDFLTTLKLSLDVFDEEDRQILNEAEKIYWKNFLNEKEMLRKQIFYTAIGIITYLKYKHLKSLNLKEQNLRIKFFDESDENLLNQKKNYESMKKKYSNSGRDKLDFELNQTFDCELRNDENLKYLYLNFYNFQDQTEYLNLIATNSNSYEIGIHDTITGRLRYIFNPHINGAILVVVKNQFIKSFTDTPALFSYNKANILSFILNFTKFEDYKRIFKVYDDLLKTKEYDQIVLTNCLVMFLFAVIKKLKLKENYTHINQIMKSVMNFYTNGFNKRIDTEIFGLITSVIRICSPNEIHKIFFSEENFSNIEYNSLIFFDYDDSFLLKSIDLLFSKFNYRIYLIFNKGSLHKLDQILENFFEDKIKWRKNSVDFERFYNIYLFIKRIITFDHKDSYVHSYSENIETEIQRIIKLNEKHQSKECLKLLNIIFKESLGYLINHPSLMVHIISHFVAYIRLDNKNFSKIFDTISTLFYKMFCPRNINIWEFLSLFKNLIEKCNTPDSVKFYINIIRKLIVPRLNLLIKNESECFKEFSHIIEVIKTNKCRKYFCHLILSYIINLIDDSTTHSIIHSLIDKIYLEKTNCVCLSKNKPIECIVTILSAFLMKYELYIKTSTELLILKFKELNNKYLKNNGDASKIIRKSMSEFYNRYSYTFEFVNKNLSPECGIAIKELSKSHSYFI